MVISQEASENYYVANNSYPKSIKEIAESADLTSTIPSNYVYFPALDSHDSLSDHDHHHDDDCESIPVIDFSLLRSGTPHQRSQVIQDLGNACLNWGFFMVVNHGMSEDLMKSMMDTCNEFFNLTVEEKQEFEGKHVLDPIRYGTSFNTSIEEVNCWRDYLKVMVHPIFHSPSKPYGFSEISNEYCKQVREVASVLLRGISTSLGLDELEIHRSMNPETGQQILIANYYPPCPEPDIAIGLPPHSDHGLLTFLAQNQVDGLQIQHNGKWIHVHGLPNSFLVNTADHIEIFSNGKYKSVVHRAVVNSRATRISVAIANGPSLDASVGPSPLLINNSKEEEEEDEEEEGSGDVIARYKSITYREYIYLQQSNQLYGKSVLDTIRI